jgi:flagellar protein FlaJ
MYEKLIHFFGKYGLKIFGNYTKSLKELVEKSNLPIIYEKYLGQLFFYSFLSLFGFLIYFFYLFYTFWGYNIITSLTASIILSTTITFLIATIFYFYPFYKFNKQLADIDSNLPLGVSYMSIISKSGVPPEKMFKYVAEKEEFGEFSKECERIYKYLSIVGRDINSAIREVASRSPSEKFKNFLEGFVATILSGSDLNLYLSSEARKGVVIYKEKQKKITSIMGFFLDIFIVLLLIAPLVIVIMLTSFSLVESQFLNFDIKFLIIVVTYVALPIGGIIFLAALNSVKI